MCVILSCGVGLTLTASPSQIAAATGRGSASDCLSERFRIRIARSDMFTLTGLQWLNDEVGGKQRVQSCYTMSDTCVVTPHYRKGGKRPGNFFYSSLLCCSVQCGTNHSAVFCHMSAIITTSLNCETMSSCFAS